MSDAASTAGAVTSDKATLRTTTRLPRIPPRPRAPEDRQGLSGLAFSKPNLTFYETWPANSRDASRTGFDARPHFFQHLLERIHLGLARLHHEFPGCNAINPLANPFQNMPVRQDVFGAGAMEQLDTAAPFGLQSVSYISECETPIGDSRLPLRMHSQVVVSAVTAAVIAAAAGVERDANAAEVREDDSATSDTPEPSTAVTASLSPSETARPGILSPSATLRDEPIPDRDADKCFDPHSFRQARVQVFRKAAFEFSSGFKTYRPLLRWIVHEFESFHSHLEKEVIRLRDLLSVCRREALGLRTELEAERAAGAKTKEEHKRVVAEYRGRLKGAEKRDWRIVDRLRTAEQDTLAAQAETREAEEANAVLLRRMQQLEFSLRDAIEASQNDKEVTYLRDKCQELEEKHRLLERVHQHTMQENLSLRSEVKKARRPNDTPRPDWTSLAEHVDYDGNTQEAVLKLAKRARALEVEQANDPKRAVCPQGKTGVLFTSSTPEDLFRTASEMGLNWLPPFGFDGSLPVMLRGTLPVRITPMAKAETVGQVHAFWASRAEKPDLPIEDALTDFLSTSSRRSSGTPPTPSTKRANARTAGLTLASALRRWEAESAECWLTARVVFGDLNEELWNVQGRLVASFSDAVAALDQQGGGRGRVARERVVRLLEEISGSEEQFQELNEALDFDLPVEPQLTGRLPVVPLQPLENGYVVQKLRRQFLSERQAYLGDLQDAVFEAALPEFSLTPQALAAAAWRNDAGAPVQDVDAIVAAAFAVSHDDLLAMSRPVTGVPGGDMLPAAAAVGEGVRFYGLQQLVTPAVAMSRIRRSAAGYQRWRGFVPRRRGAEIAGRRRSRASRRISQRVLDVGPRARTSSPAITTPKSEPVSLRSPKTISSKPRRGRGDTKIGAPPPRRASSPEDRDALLSA